MFATEKHASSLDSLSLPGSPELHRIVHPELGSWLNFRKSLRAHYGVVWFDIAFSIAMMAIGFAAHLFITMERGNRFGAGVGIFFSFWIGFWLNSLITFGHEAAHYNLAANRKLNDRLGDWAIWLFIPRTTNAYRISHWQHHRHLGDHEDTEISYQNCLSPWFLAKAITFTYPLIRIFSGGPARSTSKPGASPRSLLPLVRTLTVNFLLAGIAIALKCYATVVVWIIASACVFPFLVSVRQILEHRAVEADCATDFQEVLHGPVNRMFGKGLFSRYYGAAGFNRHLLHHWDPTVSYTRFDDMERFLQGTALAERLASCRTTYVSSFWRLLKKGVNAEP